MAKNRSLNSILKDVDRNESTDHEGDRSYRLHVDTAKELIKEAYESGVVQSETNSKSKTETVLQNERPKRPTASLSISATAFDDRHRR